MVVSRHSLLVLAALVQYAFIGAEAQAPEQGRNHDPHIRAPRQIRPRQGTPIFSLTAQPNSPIPRSSSPPSSSIIALPTDDTASKAHFALEEDSSSEPTSNIKKEREQDDAFVFPDGARLPTTTLTLDVSLFTNVIYPQDLPPMDKGQVDEPPEPTLGPEAKSPSSFGIDLVPVDTEDGEIPSASEAGARSTPPVAFRPASVWQSSSGSSTESTISSTSSAGSATSTVASTSTFSPSTPPPPALSLPSTSAPDPDSTTSTGSKIVPFGTGISNSTAKGVPLSTPPRYTNTSSLPSVKFPLVSPTVSFILFNSSVPVATALPDWTTQLSGNTTIVKSAPEAFPMCRAVYCNGAIDTSEINNCTRSRHGLAGNDTAYAEGVAPPSTVHVVVTITIADPITTLSTTTHTSTVTCHNYLECMSIQDNLATEFGVETVTLATWGNVDTTYSLTTYTSVAVAGQYKPAMAAATAFNAAAAVKQLPLGGTVYNGTFNTCLLPPGAINTIVHCWGLGVKPPQLTCFEQPVDGAPTVLTDTVEVMRKCMVITTLKVPTIVTEMASDSMPNYGYSGPTDEPHYTISKPAINTNLVLPGGNRDTGIGAPVETDTPVQTTWIGTTTVPISIVPSGVVIGSSTIYDDPNGASETIVVDSQTYIVGPSKISGLGTTVNRPAWSNNWNAYYPDAVITPALIIFSTISGFLGGLPVQVSSNSIQVDGTTFSIPAQPTVATVHGSVTVYLGPDGVAAGGETLSMSPVLVSAAPGINGNGGNGAAGGGGSEVVVAGGTLLTIDNTNVVVDGHSIAYNAAVGALATSTVITVAGDAITIVPASKSSGGGGGGSNGGHGGAFIVVHGTTLTAPAAGSTHYELVGGATFTEVSPSVIVLDGHSYTIGPSAAAATGGLAAAVAGPGATPTTVVVGGETVTIGPGGVTVGGTLTFRYPFGATPAVTLTGVATVTGTAAMRPGAVGGLQSNTMPTATSMPQTADGMGASDSNNAGKKNSSSRPVSSVMAIVVSLMVSLGVAMSSLIYFV